MENIKITGRIISVKKENGITKGNKEWFSTTLIVGCKQGQYENFLCLKDMSDLRVKEGYVCDFEFFPICREWKGKWFTELRISKLSLIDRPSEQVESKEPIDVFPEETDNLPF